MIGFVILIGLCTLEIILFIVSTKIKNFNYNIIRSVRNFILAFFLGLIVIGVIKWSFRYYALIIALVLMVVKSNVLWIKAKTKLKHNTYKTKPWKTILTVIILFLALTPALIFPDYKPLPITGIYEIKTSKLILTDNNRYETFSEQNDYRQVNIHAWYPDDANEEAPLIIYSHGGISLDTSNESLFRELASQGYAVFSIGHPYHSILTKNSDNKNVWIDSEYMQELNNENASENPENSFMLYKKWMKLRTDDINFVIDYIKFEAEKENPQPIFELVNTEKIAVVGHSLGGSAALCIGRTRNDVQAVIALESPYMGDILGVDDQAFIIDDSEYPVPVLNIYSDSTWDKLSILPQYEQNNNMLDSNASFVTNKHISGTGHFSLTDLSLTSPIMARMLNGFASIKDSKEVLLTINSISLKFLDEHLKNQN